MLGYRTAPPPLPSPPHFNQLRGLSPAEQIGRFAGTERRPWLEAASLYGLVEAQALLGQHELDSGKCDSALSWFRIAAEAGHGPAMTMVGRCHELGWGVARDRGVAAGWYRRGAAAGHDWAHFNLAMMAVEDGAYGDALGYARAAAGLGHAKALTLLGRFAEEGWAGARDLRQAAALYHRAAQAGCDRAQFNWAVLLVREGRYPEALGWLRRALAGAEPYARAQIRAALPGLLGDWVRGVVADQWQDVQWQGGTPSRGAGSIA